MQTINSAEQELLLKLMSDNKCDTAPCFFLCGLSLHTFIASFVLLAQYIAINRETIDIDFLMTKIKNEMQTIERVINSKYL
ncbi:MAG: hypothetical protein ACD_46C00315G0004 [uncultured bacterium]|nr:MAG: hypothetical protein ACD_46C00315G0004 [uncultured bacterium]